MCYSNAYWRKRAIDKESPPFHFSSDSLLLFPPVLAFVLLFVDAGLLFVDHCSFGCFYLDKLAPGFDFLFWQR